MHFLIECRNNELVTISKSQTQAEYNTAKFGRKGRYLNAEKKWNLAAGHRGNGYGLTDMIAVKRKDYK